MKHVVGGMRFKDILTSHDIPEQLEIDMFNFASDLVLDRIRDIDSDPTILLGMSYGFEFIMAEACIQSQIPFIAAVALRNFDKLWPKRVKIRYYRLLDAAKKVVFVTREPIHVNKASQQLVIAAYNRRNSWMMDQLEESHPTTVHLLWDKRREGGTYKLYQEAYRRNLTINNHWDEWEEFLKQPLDDIQQDDIRVAM